jgi:hypothetical protein
MGWDRGRYYTRSRKVNGRVRREYVGRGPLGELAAALDALQRAEREAKAAEWRADRERLQGVDKVVSRLDELADLLARAALVAAGYHQHKRGEWRARRGQADRDS